MQASSLSSSLHWCLLRPYWGTRMLTPAASWCKMKKGTALWLTHFSQLPGPQQYSAHEGQVTGKQTRISTSLNWCSADFRVAGGGFMPFKSHTWMLAECFYVNKEWFSPVVPFIFFCPVRPLSMAFLVELLKTSAWEPGQIFPSAIGLEVHS